ncbi:YceD family protein, partial [Acinetobacter soli]
MSANTFPAQIEPYKWAEQGFTWSGTLPLSRFARIAREAVGSINDQLIYIDCKLSMDAYHRVVWFDGHVETKVPLECQRCLEPVEIPLVSDFRLALIDDESLIERLDEDDQVDWLILHFNHWFSHQNVTLVKGEVEPEYFPASNHAPARIQF